MLTEEKIPCEAVETAKAAQERASSVGEVSPFLYVVEMTVVCPLPWAHKAL
jgi:hypothetical protein